MQDSAENIFPVQSNQFHHLLTKFRLRTCIYALARMQQNLRKWKFARNFGNLTGRTARRRGFGNALRLVKLQESFTKDVAADIRLL